MRDEGSRFSNQYPGINDDITEKVFKKWISLANQIYHDINEGKVTEFYLQNVDKTNSTALKRAFWYFLGDIMMKCPTYYFAKQFAQNNPKRKTYFFEQTYELDMERDEKTLGIHHGADVPFVFGLPLLNPQNSTKVDIEFSIEVMKMWTNFAKTGYEFKNL